MICHNIHNCNLCGLDEFFGCVSSNCLQEKMISHKIHICDPCDLHELYMPLQIHFLWKRFSTRFTFVVFNAFMNRVLMSLQIASLRKWFATRMALEILFIVIPLQTSFFLQSIENFVNLFRIHCSIWPLSTNCRCESLFATETVSYLLNNANT